MGLGLWKEMSDLHRILFQARCRVEEEEMMETFGNVLMCWSKWQCHCWPENGPGLLPWGWLLSRPVQGTHGPPGSRVSVTVGLPYQDDMFSTTYCGVTLLVGVYLERDKIGTWKLFKVEGREEQILLWNLSSVLTYKHISSRPYRCWKKRLWKCQW